MAKFKNYECIVLKCLNYKDTDKIYTLYSKERGKFSASARGVRKISSKRGGNLDTLNHIIVSIREGSKGFSYITEVKSKNTFSNVKTNLEFAGFGFYIAELVHKFIGEDQQNIEVFALLVKTLRLLDSKKIKPVHVVNFFEVNLMRLLGYGLTLNKCVLCGREFSADWKVFRLNFGLGGFVCDKCGSLGIEISKLDAKFLNSLERQKIFANGGNYDFSQANKLLKVYVKDVLEGFGGSFTSLEIF